MSEGIRAPASILASVIIGAPSAPPETAAPVVEPGPAAESEIAAIRNEPAAMRQLVEKLSTERRDAFRGD